MAKVRYAVLENDKTLTSTLTSGTETVDLPETGILEELYVNATYTKAYSNDRCLADWDAVTKLEILVDGSTVVKSLSGQEARALQWYNKGAFGPSGEFWSTGGDTDCYTILPLYFNKKAGDHTCGLNLDNYSNPQLKISFDTSTTSIDGNTYDAATSPSFKYNVLAKVVDGIPAGFTNRYVQSREIDSFTATASVEHTTEIPRGYDLKGLMHRSGYKGVTWTSSVGHQKLDFDNGKWVPIDMDHEDIKAAFLSWFPEPVHVGWYDHAASGDDCNLQVHQVMGMGNAAGNTNTAQIWFDMHECGLYDIVKNDYAGAAITSGVKDHIAVTGWGPMQSVYLPMEQLVDGAADSVRTTDYGRIDYKILAGSSNNASQKAYIVAEYYKPNGQ